MATREHFLFVLMIMLGLWENGNAQFGGASLTPEYYLWTCPEAEPIVFDGVARAVARDSRMAASLLRMHFHDCFVQVNPLPPFCTLAHRFLTKNQFVIFVCM